MRWGRLVVRNHRGAWVPASLGVVLLAPGAVAGGLGAWVALAARGEPMPLAGAVSVLASILVFAGGLVDDLAPPGPRGLRGHLRAVAEGRVTTGVLKLLVGAAASVVTVAAFSGHAAHVRIAGVVLLAGCANLWNGLDVRPGRALKAFVLTATAALAAGLDLLRGAPAVLGVLPASVAALPFDVRERAMLGDGGSNLLGFTAGVSLYAVLPGSGVLAGAAAVVLLNLLAETVTLSRLIQGTPPLRWLDRLWRLPDP